jgi:hypothetical protein
MAQKNANDGATDCRGGLCDCTDGSDIDRDGWSPCFCDGGVPASEAVDHVETGDKVTVEYESVGVAVETKSGVVDYVAEGVAFIFDIGGDGLEKGDYRRFDVGGDGIIEPSTAARHPAGRLGEQATVVAYTEGDFDPGGIETIETVDPNCMVGANIQERDGDEDGDGGESRPNDGCEVVTDGGTVQDSEGGLSIEPVLPSNPVEDAVWEAQWDLEFREGADMRGFDVEGAIKRSTGTTIRRIVGMGDF